MPQPDGPPPLLDGEADLVDAVRQAMAAYLDEAAAVVLDGRPPTSLTAAVDLGRWPDDSVWTRAVQRLVRPVAQRLYQRAYRRTADEDAPRSRLESWTSGLLARLAPQSWPRRVWAAVQQAYITSLSDQEPPALLEARLRDILRLDAPGQEYRERTARLRAIASGADHRYDGDEQAREAAADELAQREASPAPDGAGRPWESDAARIAGNEASGATWSATVEAAQDTQPEAMKRWVARDDDRTRPAHRDADGQTVRVHDTFTVDTEALMFPGDPAASPENGINCRCEVRIIPAAQVAGASKETAPMTTTTEEITAAVTARTDLPFAPRDTAWDADEARARLREWATPNDGELDPKKYGQGFLYAPEGDDADDVDAYALPYATIVDGELTAVWKGITAAAAAVQGGRGGVDLPTATVDKVRSRLDALYAAAAKAFEDDTIRPPWDAATVRASLVAAAALDAPPVVFDGAIDVWGEDGGERPPAGYFDKPDWLSGPDSLPIPDGVEPFEPGKPRVVVYPDGRLIGYTATWTSCHVGFPNECVPPPPDAPTGPGQLGYQSFHRAPVRIADGALRLGKVTMDTGHAAVGLNAAAAVTHYDNTGTLAALVRAGEDDAGIWIAGSVVPWLDGRGRALLAMSELSGDWRTVNGVPLQMIASLAVNHGGFIASAGEPGTDDTAPADGKAKSEGGCGCSTATAAADGGGDTAAAAEAPKPDAADAAALEDLGPLDDNLAALVAAVAVAEDVPDDVVAAVDKDMKAIAAAAAGGELTAANWVEQTGTGHLPPYIRRIADHLLGKGMDQSRAIATAVNVVKKACSNPDGLNFPGVQKPTGQTRAQACQAVAQWEAKKAEARLK